MSKQDFIESHKEKLLQIYKEKSGSEEGFEQWLTTPEADEIISNLIQISEAIRGSSEVDKKLRDIYKDYYSLSGLLFEADYQKWLQSEDAQVELKQIKEESMSKTDEFPNPDNSLGVNIFNDMPLDKQLFVNENRNKLEAIYRVSHILGSDDDFEYWLKDDTDGVVAFLMQAPSDVLTCITNEAVFETETNDIFSQSGVDPIKASLHRISQGVKEPEDRKIDDLLDEEGEPAWELPFNGCEDMMQNVQLNELALTCMQNIEELGKLYRKAGDKNFSKEARVFDLLVAYIKNVKKAEDAYEDLNFILQG